MSDLEHIYRTTVVSAGGSVFVSLPDDQYIKMDPEQARQFAARIFREAALALGEAPPSMVVIVPEAEL